MLCDLLKATGVAGRPASYYRRQSVPRWTERLGLQEIKGAGFPAFERVYLDAVLRAGRDEHGRFGMRLMWESLPELLAKLETVIPSAMTDLERLEAAFGRTLFVNLKRQDQVAQAISRLKAEQSGLWHINLDGSPREQTEGVDANSYDKERISAFMAEAQTGDSNWKYWFSRWSIKPLSMTYESLAHDPQGQLSRVLVALGENPERAKTTAMVGGKMADAQSRHWAKRFRLEAGLDVPAT